MQDSREETTHLCGGLGETRKQPFGLCKSKRGGHGFPLALVYLTYLVRTWDMTIHRTLDNITISPSKAAIEKHRNNFTHAIRLSVNSTRVLKNVVDGLGIGDP